MLARFIVPVARLDEFEEVGQAVLPVGSGSWQVSALIGSELDHDLERIAKFNRGAQQIDTIEMKVVNAGQIETAAERIPRDLTAYCEIADATLLPAIRAAGARAKIRTGGVTPEMFPDAAYIAQFLEACARENVAFKATAGLHHPLRCYRPLTYSVDGPSGWMYGFLNLFTAAVLARRGVPASELEPILLAESASHLPPLTEMAEIASVRRDFAISFGSCSFEEPIADLKALKLL